MNGKKIRMRRLFKHNENRLLVVPMDHPVSEGPFANNQEFASILHGIAESKADAIVIHKGRVRHLTEEIVQKCSVIVHVSASTKFSNDPNEKYIVSGVEDAIRRGADCISLHVNIGSTSEAKQIKDMATVADACDRYGVPLLAMIYARGEEIGHHALPEVLAHAANLATDLGADLVKLSMPKSLDDIEWIVSRSPLPILAAGGAKTNEAEFLSFVEVCIRGGVIGFAAGRNIFQSSNIPACVNQIRLKMDNRRIGNRLQDGMIYANKRDLAVTYNEPL